MKISELMIRLSEHLDNMGNIEVDMLLDAERQIGVDVENADLCYKNSNGNIVEPGGEAFNDTPVVLLRSEV